MTVTNNITAVTAAILAAISAIRVDAVCPFVAVDQYGGSDDQNLRRIAGTAPGAFVKYLGGALRPVNNDRGTHLHSADYLIVITVPAARSSADASEDAAEYAKLITTALAGSALSLSMEPLTFSALELIGSVADVELWALKLATRLEW